MKSIFTATNRWLPALLIASVCWLMHGCAAVQRAGMAVLYKKTDLPPAQVKQNLSYANETPGNSSNHHRLDLFLPQGTNWPVLIFVHGGGWEAGDKSLRVSGADVYGNIGRFFASRGIGTAVINYRLQPTVTWRDQVQDVAQATAWVRTHIPAYGGNARDIFLMGHSAGAQLATHVALNPQPLAQAGITSNILCGVISVSGAGLDLADEKSYQLGHNIKYYEKRFRGESASDSWQREASPIAYIQSNAPPFLILYAGGEDKSLQRQSARLHEALTQQGVSNRILEVPGQSHARIVLTLSRPDKTAVPAILKFIEARRCE